MNVIKTNFSKECSFFNKQEIKLTSEQDQESTILFFSFFLVAARGGRGTQILDLGFRYLIYFFSLSDA